jgi:integrase
MAISFLTKSRHNSVYYFRRRVPDDLIRHIGKPYLVKSLHTYEKRLAIILARNLATQTDNFFISIRNMSKDSINDGLIADFKLEINLNELGKPTKIVVEAEAHEKEAVDSAIATALGNSQPTLKNKSSTDPQRQLSAAVQEYYDKAQGLKPNTIANYKSKLKHACGFFGDSTDILKLEQIDIVKYADYVNKSITNNTTRGLYIQIFATFLNWHRIRHGLSSFTTRTLIPKRIEPASNDREAFSLDDMKVLFSNASKYRFIEPHKWWATVAVGFMGCRIEELAQVNIQTDLEYDEASKIWYFKFNEHLDEDGTQKKSMKKITSWRHVPIHSALVQFGFIDFLKEQTKAGYSRPFEQGWQPRIVEKDKIHKWSHYITKWAGNELVKLDKLGDIKKNKKTYFHSMRHTFSGLLGDEQVPSEIIESLSGRKTGGDDEERYKKLKTNHNRLSQSGIEIGLIKLTEVLDGVVS